MLDATKSDEHRRLLELELDAVGIRLNKSKPNVVFKRRTTGGVSGDKNKRLNRSTLILNLQITVRTICYDLYQRN
jgi:ribosome-interacting GTPase 1